MTLAYLGPQGTFCEIAAKAYIERFSKPLELVPCASIYDVIDAVDAGMAKEGVVPIENSVEGAVSVTLDRLAEADVKVKIIHEIDLDIVHNLMVKPGAEQVVITDIYSHPQSLAQCQHYLRKHYPQALLHPMQSNAQAVVAVKDNSVLSVAAIGPLQAAQQWHLSVIAEGIQDYQNTQTRFVAISKNPIRRTEKTKTSIVFATQKDRPGALYEILGYFAQNNINLTKIESRPRKQALGDYVFFIDLAGSDEDPVVEAVLKEVGSRCSYFKKLGSYTNH